LAPDHGVSEFSRVAEHAKLAGVTAEKPPCVAIGIVTVSYRTDIYQSRKAIERVIKILQAPNLNSLLLQRIKAVIQG
jgi:hypothetical protein